ncbi:hypothetical protein LC55x_3378 [Lysobacter capsici]|uniref:hypothetical protein n=1 Tax=Lysobacter capsici TaxID=435897 RepID=UPI0007164E8C|nr:hypothetical protein [Lysobacter capsici]ALN86636.1 hypothetical protein LC55x_3378 [Lysobacter capsici]
MQTQSRANRLGLIALAAFGFAASLSAMADDRNSCESCRIDWEYCLGTSLPQDAHVCDMRYVQCAVPLNCPISNY